MRRELTIGTSRLSYSLTSFRFLENTSVSPEKLCFLEKTYGEVILWYDINKMI